jgi:hypothetical protein
MARDSRRRYLEWVVALVLGMGLWGCGSDDGGGLPHNPAVPAGVDITDNSQMFLWKLQPKGQAGCPGPRAVARWPSYMVSHYGVTADNSYVMAGTIRMEFYKYDDDFGGRKPSYAACVNGASELVADQEVILYKNGKAVAFAIVPNPGVRYFAPLP